MHHECESLQALAAGSRGRDRYEELREGRNSGGEVSEGGQGSTSQVCESVMRRLPKH